jgi:nucleotide-binding universal stress UspA family protein
VGSECATRVIVGVDGSVAGLRALRLAVAEARRRGAELHAIRVWSDNGAWETGSECLANARQVRAATELSMAFAATMGRVPDDIEVVAMAAGGRPGPILVTYAHRDADLLVVGTTQRGWLRRLFRRSTARYCVAHAACPVVAVPPDTFARTVSPRRLARDISRELPALGG